MSAFTQRDNASNGGSGGAHTPEPRYLVVGRVLRPHGVRGELRVEIITGFPERLGQHDCFYLAHQDTPEDVARYLVEEMRQHQGALLLKLAGCDDRNAAELLRDLLVQIPVQDAVPLDEGEFYHFQIVGARVETEEGEWLGQVAEVLETGANDVYLVRGPRGEVLLPAIEDVVREVDIEAKRMVVRPLPGMLGKA